MSSQKNIKSASFSISRFRYTALFDFHASVVGQPSASKGILNILYNVILTQRISDAGYQGEIASVATASTFVGVFSGVLLESLDKLREEDDVGLLDKLPDLIVCVNVLKFLLRWNMRDLG
jgi:hypothetical protein